MTAAEYLELFYPYLFDVADPRYVEETKRGQFLTAAAMYRPSCLSEDAQNQAQAHYAAYLMGATYSETGTGGSSVGVSGPVIRERQGTSEVEYARASDTGPGGATGPVTAYARWEALSLLCRRGAITAGRAFWPYGPR